MRKINFFNEGFYHVYNRGALKQPIFFEESDYARFVHDLWEFNDLNHAIDFREVSKIFGDSVSVATETESPRISRQTRDPVVAILTWSLMPNHFHLFLQQLKEGGVSSFMHKLGTGYTTYVNKKYERNGHLFQGSFKVKPIDKENYFLHISRYIHLNPTELIEPAWKEEGIKDWQKVHDFLENYRWSSYQDWIGKKNFPSVLDLKGVEGVFGGVEKYKQFMKEWAIGYYGKMQPVVAG